MIRFIICEDKPRDLEKARGMINKVMMSYETDYRINVYDDLTEELEKIITSNMDKKIYILDIELKNSSGLEVASRIREDDWDSYIIFVTSHSECKNESFYARSMAIDYISKYAYYEERLGDTILAIMEKMERQKFFQFTFRNNSYCIPFKQITYIEKEPDQRRCYIHTDGGEAFPVIMSITDIMKKLGPNFYQSHQSGIINKDKIKHIDFTNNMITLCTNEKINLLSVRKKKGLRNNAKRS